MIGGGWPAGLHCGDVVRVRSDDDPKRSLQVLIANDGDVHVSMPGPDGFGPYVRVCTAPGGGRNHRTRLALLHLMVAMKEDAADPFNAQHAVLVVDGSEGA